MEAQRKATDGEKRKQTRCRNFISPLSRRANLLPSPQALERDVEAQRKATDAEKRKQDELTRERDILNKLKTQAENATTKQQDLVRVNEGAKKNLEQEIQGYRAEAERQQKLILQLEREREKYGAEASQVGAKYLQVSG